MRLEGNSAKIILNRQKSGKQELEAVRGEKGAFEAQAEGVSAGLWLEETNGCVLGRVKVSLKNESCRENDNLALTNPVTVCLERARQPLRMSALYLHRD